MNGFDAFVAAMGLVVITILAIMNYSIQTDAEYNATKRKEMEEETKRMLHGDK